MDLAKVDIAYKLFSMLVVIISAALNVYLFIKSKQDKRFNSLQDRVITDENKLIEHKVSNNTEIHEIRMRVGMIESQIKQMPTHNDINEIHKRISDLANSMSTVAERSRNTDSAVNRIENYLMERK